MSAFLTPSLDPLVTCLSLARLHHVSPMPARGTEGGGNVVALRPACWHARTLLPGQAVSALTSFARRGEPIHPPDGVLERSSPRGKPLKPTIATIVVLAPQPVSPCLDDDASNTYFSCQQRTQDISPFCWTGSPIRSVASELPTPRRAISSSCSRRALLSNTSSREKAHSPCSKRSG